MGETGKLVEMEEGHPVECGVVCSGRCCCDKCESYLEKAVALQHAREKVAKYASSTLELILAICEEDERWADVLSPALTKLYEKMKRVSKKKLDTPA